MHIAVLAKVVPDYGVPFADFELVSGRASPRYTRMLGMYDENALELGVQLKQKTQALLSVLACGPEDDVPVLRKALAMGADQLYLTGGTQEDPLALAENLRAGLDKLPPCDLILAGRQCSDIERGLVPAMLAAKLGVPFINQVITLEQEGGRWLARQITDNGWRDLAFSGPAVVSVTSHAGNVPRIPAVKDIFAAKKKKVETASAAAAPGLALKERATEVVKMESVCEMLPVEDFKATAQLLLARLKEERYL